jgi:CBS domain-containing protein
MTLARIAKRFVDTAEPGETVRTAAQRMDARNVGALVVKDPAGRPIGIVTDRDLTVRVLAVGLDPDQTLVRDAWTPSPATIRQDLTVEEALSRMRSRGVRRLPLVDDEGLLVGIVTLHDILGLIVEEFWELGGLLERTSPDSIGRLG